MALPHLCLHDIGAEVNGNDFVTPVSAANHGELRHLKYSSNSLVQHGVGQTAPDCHSSPSCEPLQGRTNKQICRGGWLRAEPAAIMLYVHWSQTA